MQRELQDICKLNSLKSVNHVTVELSKLCHLSEHSEPPNISSANGVSLRPEHLTNGKSGEYSRNLYSPFST